MPEKIKHKIKICCVANVDITIKFLLLPEFKFLIKEGYDVYAVCSPGKWISDIEKEGIKVKTIKITRNITPLYDLITLYRLWSYFRKEKFDIVHTNTPKPGLLGQLAAKLAGTPIIINTIHGFYFQNGSPYLKRKFFILIEKIAAKCSDLIFHINKEDVKTAIEEGVCSSKLIKYLGEPVNINRFNPERFSKEFIDNKKKELNIPADFKIVGIIARMVQEKGYLDLFKAFKLTLKVFPKTILLIIGPEEPEKKDAINQKAVENYDIEKNVIFLGERTDVNEICALMDVFVLPSYREGLGISILEASAMEKPVIATNIRGCREAVDDGETGILVPVKSPEKIAEALIYFLENPTKAKEMGKKGRLKVAKEFDERIIFGKIKECYQKLIEDKLSGRKSEKKIYQAVKRFFDFVAAFIVLILLSPLFLIIAVLIKLDSNGTVFYRGERVGRFGKTFKIWKFRTMVPNAEKTGTIHASRNDPRITKIGGFLRTYKLDELPQLMNILKGEMSFVGPRPQVKYYVDFYNDEEKISLNVRPGMTDYATICYINQEDIVDEKNVDKSYREKIEPLKNELRIKYAKNSSLFIDAKIVFQTILVIVKKIVLKKK